MSYIGVMSIWRNSQLRGNLLSYINWALLACLLWREVHEPARRTVSWWVIICFLYQWFSTLWVLSVILSRIDSTSIVRTMLLFSYYIRGPDRLVGIATGLRAGRLTVRGSVPGRCKRFFFVASKSASCTVSAEGSFLRSKTPWAWRWITVI
jgi:hypothetical protein